MRILAIETSCDETASAIIEDMPASNNGLRLISNVIATSSKMHVETGGIIPERAARAQIQSIIPVLAKSINQAIGVSNNKNQLSINNKKLIAYIKQKIDAFAVTVGPGLIGSLLVGVETAKTLSFITNKPVISVNHLIGHIYANFITEDKTNKKDLLTSHIPVFPAVALVVSGGHTDLVLMKGHGEIKWIGGTRDDAAGEAFDKCARLLGLGYPGGPIISNEAEIFFSKSDIINFPSLGKFPRPMIKSKNFDFSFSGLKTSVLKETKKLDKNKKYYKNQIPKMAAQVQEAIVDVLVAKSLRAIKKYKPKSFILSGGVAANKRLKESFAKELKKLDHKVLFFVPPVFLCTDNAAMIAAAAYYKKTFVSWKNLTANPQLTITG